MVRWWCPSAPLAMKPFEIGQKGREREGEAAGSRQKEREGERRATPPKNEEWRERKEGGIGSRRLASRYGESELNV